MFIKYHKVFMLGVVAYAFHLSTQEAGASRSEWQNTQGYRDPVSKKSKNQQQQKSKTKQC